MIDSKLQIYFLVKLLYLIPHKYDGNSKYLNS